MRLFLCALALVALAACSGDEDRGFSNPVAARFAAEAGDRIEVTVADPQPVETAELVAPDGAATEAYQIDRSKTVEEDGRASPSVGVGVFGGSSGHIGTSIGIGIPIFGSGAPEDPVIDSRVLIRVPDMAAYRASWQDYRLRLHLGTTDTNRRIMEIPAPRPPEG
jgi:hypothetical protein